MIVKSVRMAPFGGLHGKEVTFKDGLNVVLGPNEAGKSTMVGALFAVFFLPTNLHRNSPLWKDYLARFLPYGVGDTIEVAVNFQCDAKDEYLLTRSWGAARNCRLESASGVVISTEEMVQEKLLSLLRYGRGTYESILFARQEDMLKTVELISQNQEAVATLGDVLRTAFLQSGGVSPEELAQELAQAKKDLLANWDLQRDGPKKNRGVDNPYVKNVGKLLSAYYEKESLRRQLQAAEEAEKKVEVALAALEKTSAEKAALLLQKVALEKLENDVYRRAKLEPKIGTLRLQEEKLKLINSQWPREKERLANITSSIEQNQIRLKTLSKDLELAKAAVEAKKMRERYLAAKPLQEELLALEAKLASLPAVTGEDVTWLQQQQNLIANKQAELQAMELVAKVSLTKPQTVTVKSTSPAVQQITVTDEALFKGEGYLQFTAEGWSVYVQAGRCDVEALLAEIQTLQTARESKLQQLSLQNISEARQMLELRQALTSQIERLRAKLEAVLQGQAYTELAKAAASCPDTMMREPESILTEYSQVQVELTHAISQKEEIQQRLKAWEKEYGYHETVMEQLATILNEKRQAESELSQLAPLPAAYTDTDSFFAALKELRRRTQEVEELFLTAKEQLLEAQQEQGEETAEDIKVRYREAEDYFSRIKEEAALLLKVEAKFNQLMSQLNEKTFTPLYTAFCRYLGPATAYRYQAAELEGTLPNRLEAADGTALSLEFLSTGTARGMALALRLAMAEFLLEQRNGFLVMDDPLVDLDPQRKAHAAAMVREYAKQRQVIITTCDPDTAAKLGGYMIKL